MPGYPAERPLAHRLLERVKVDEDNIGSLSSRADSPNDTPASLSSASARPGIFTGGLEILSGILVVGVAG